MAGAMNVKLTLTAENGQLVVTFAGTAKVAKGFGDKIERAGRQIGAGKQGGISYGDCRHLP